MNKCVGLTENIERKKKRSVLAHAEIANMKTTKMCKQIATIVMVSKLSISNGPMV